MKNINLFLYNMAFWLGYIVFKVSGNTPYYSYIAMRKCFISTGGSFNDKLSQSISKSQRNKLKNIDLEGSVLENITEQDKNYIVSNLKENGFHIFDQFLNEELTNSLTQLALESECIVLDSKKTFKYDRDNIVSTRYSIPEKAMVDNPAVQKLMTDPVILSIAQNYLESIPISDLVTMWWSTTYQKEANSKAAQLFHFDMDRLKFIKFFVYLSDVDDNNGPHVYVGKSHKTLPEELRTDGRKSDTLINKHYKSENIKTIKGKKGTMFLADTRGIHKGEPLVSGERLMFQLEYTNSMFGASNNSIEISKENSLVKSKEKHPVTFERYYTN
jgi:ectoine hydroxylase-related dioxygenase (phytanoyl-CoA dioxygenase family)